MDVIGRGFLATNLARISGKHQDVVVFAAGPSSTVASSAEEFGRETDAVHKAILRCREEGKMFVYFSTASAAMYGAPDSPGTEDGPVFPGNAYGRHKLTMEALIRASGVAFLVLRLAHLVGPDQRPHQMMPTLVAQVRSGEIEVWRGAHRDLIDVLDVVRLLDALLTGRVCDEVVNIASGVAVPVEDVVAHLEKRLRVPLRKTYREAYARHDISLAKLTRLAPVVRELGFGPDYYRRVVDRYLSATTGVPLEDLPTAG